MSWSLDRIGIAALTGADVLRALHDVHPPATDRSRLAPGDAQSINPQPLPPGGLADLHTRFDAVMLNPQPLPPCGLAALHTRFDAVMLNPQPLPPGGLSAIFTRFDAVMLNPQPLPPREGPHAERRLDAETLNPEPPPLPDLSLTSPPRPAWVDTLQSLQGRLTSRY